MQIDCKTISEPGPQVESAEMVLATQGAQVAGVPSTVLPPIAPSQPQAEETGGYGVASIGDDGLPSTQKVLNFIALKLFQTIDPSKPEDFNGFLQYMEKVRKVLILDVQSGSLILTVECRSLETLEGLWEDYCNGLLNEMAEKYLVTEDVLTVFGLTGVKLTTTILEDDYRACREYIKQSQGKCDLFSISILFVDYTDLNLSGNNKTNLKSRHRENMETFFLFTPYTDSYFTLKLGPLYYNQWPQLVTVRGILYIYFTYVNVFFNNFNFKLSFGANVEILTYRTFALRRRRYDI